MAPVSVTIPALGISSNLGPARGLNPDGTIDDAPLSGPTWSLPWWYEAGPAPGQMGSAVILGHVDSALGAGHLGVFFRLGNAAPGEAISVTMANGSVTSWDVASVHLYPDNLFPMHSSTGAPIRRRSDWSPALGTSTTRAIPISRAGDHRAIGGPCPGGGAAGVACPAGDGHSFMIAAAVVLKVVLDTDALPSGRRS